MVSLISLNALTFLKRYFLSLHFQIIPQLKKPRKCTLHPSFFVSISHGILGILHMIFIGPQNLKFDRPLFTFFYDFPNII